MTFHLLDGTSIEIPDEEATYREGDRVAITYPNGTVFTGIVLETTFGNRGVRAKYDQHPEWEPVVPPCWVQLVKVQ